jgi:membrane protein DedA with SNARE-associated domain
VALASISGELTSQIASHGIYAVFVLMMIDAVFPTASELVMVYGGAVAAGAFGDDLSFFGMHVDSGWAAFLAIALAGTLGYLVGAIIGWAIGLYGGRPLLEHHGRWLHLTPEKLDRAERWFDRWDVWAVLVGRVTPVIRSFISIPAGIFEMRFGPYVAWTAVGSAIWAFALAGIGWALGSNYERFHHGFRFADYAIAAGIVLLVGYFVWRKIRSSRLKRRASTDPAR